MEDLRRDRLNSLDDGAPYDNDTGGHMTANVRGVDSALSLEPTPAELAQCEAEVGTLLNIIAELNKKMGSLKAPSDPGDLRRPALSRPLVPDLLSHRLLKSNPERKSISPITTKTPATDQGGTGVVWTKLQEVLSNVEDSISFRRTWAAPISASDQDKHNEHLKAAQENWTKATTILEEMEREFGISCPLSPPKEQYMQDVLDMDKREGAIRNSSPNMQSAISLVEEERNKLISLHKSWRSGSHSPSYCSSAGALSPDWASPPFPASPLLHRRSNRGIPPLSVGVDPLGSINSGSPCPSPISLEAETERLNRYIDRLKARNERLTAALERRKSELEQITITLNRLESDCSALQMALRYCEECEEAYSELLSLYDAKSLQSTPLQTDSAEQDRERPQSPPAQLRNLGTEELSTSFSTAGVTEETEAKSHAEHRTPEPGDREAALRQQIERLKKDRAAICLPKPINTVENKLGAEFTHQAGPRSVHPYKDTHKTENKKEKPTVFHELISVREEMSDLRAVIRLREKELRYLEWSIMSQKAQETSGVFIPESLREELEDRRTEQQRLCETAAKLTCDGEISGPRTRPILKELQAVLQREQALKKRLALVHDSMGTADSDSPSHRRDNEEQIARLTQAHSKALSSYRQIRRKYREQVWRLEQKVAAMTESQVNIGGSTKAATAAAGEALEWRREETVL